MNSKLLEVLGNRIELLDNKYGIAPDPKDIFTTMLTRKQGWTIIIDRDRVWSAIFAHWDDGLLPSASAIRKQILAYHCK